MGSLKVEERRVASFDGTELACHVVGEGRPLLLGNGLGGSYKAWAHQIHHLQDRYQFISWDYRGLYRSGPPADPEALAVGDHARDALAVLDALEIDRAGVLGWSMGVQVALEIYALAPARVAVLGLINGVPGAPWESVLGIPKVGAVVPHVLAAVRSMPRVTQTVTERVVGWSGTVNWAKRIGLASQTLDEAIWADLAASFAGLDMALYMRVLEKLGEHDARPGLREVDVPVLVIAGGRDLFTPRSAMEKMVRDIDGAELLVVPKGTHYVAVEYPTEVNERLERFFQERGYA
ncbi:MAG: alpha/beta fold hydrolase [Sandaracinaceae bacterium]